ncbi:hypothetical protein PM011_10845, partial [Clostridium paraputrificum]|nr:hypothetical protein [Clostridium paraputrificum]
MNILMLVIFIIETVNSLNIKIYKYKNIKIYKYKNIKIYKYAVKKLAWTVLFERISKGKYKI